jgi:hypothetical protein
MTVPVPTAAELRSRRGLLKAATALVGGWLLGREGRPDGSPASSDLGRESDDGAGPQPVVRPPGLSVSRRK